MNPLDSSLNQRMSQDIARQAIAIEHHTCKRMPACDKALAVACVIALIVLALWG